MGKEILGKKVGKLLFSYSFCCSTYSLTPMPYSFLKQREKYLGVLKPTRYANSLMRMFGSRLSIWHASFMRMLVMSE